MRREIRFTLNGEAVSAQVAPHENLVEVLQESFGLYGARESCGQGMCGCCTVMVNGREVSAQVAPHENLVEVLQESFGLYGARESCGQGMCGCCTVMVNGRAVSGCLYLGSLIEGAEVLTVENNAEPDAVQQAFVEASAFQCGFCTPGFVLMTRQLLDEHPDPDDDTIKHYLSGNLCRCAAYPEIIEAVKLAARKRRKS